ncbi:MAG: fumarylacetoacetate hydrolase family protein [Planctomycetales bacterium]|nr:fumarylacetoacetate hydrolase family protein [Planctomycetales bacterium]
MFVRRRFVAVVFVLSIAAAHVVGLSSGAVRAAEDESVKFARFKVDGKMAYGVVEGDNVREISGSIFGDWEKTDKVHALADVRLLVPTKARQVFAMAGNYKSHLADAEIPPKFRIPQPFFKSVASLQRPEGRIVIPRDATDQVHYEAEMVIVIGRRAKDVSPEDALDYVLGVTCGNDVSERYWQNDPENKDVQWWRAKASDTFGPCGPFIATGLDYDNLLVTLRLNGEVRQQERTSQLIHDVASTVSFISQYVTLQPGDLIFTGTSGKTGELKDGDIVEVEVEGVGVLRNRVVREQ